MPTPSSQSLERTIAAIQQKWGSAALHTLEHQSAAPDRLATGVPALDAALCGGIPRGHLTELIGRPTSGLTTLALKLIAGAQGEGEPAAYVDLNSTFDAAYAAFCGVDLERLLVVRSGSVTQALEITRDLVASSAVGIVVLDAAFTDGLDTLEQDLHRLASALVKSRCALVVLAADNTIDHHAALRLHVEHSEWLRDRHGVCGYRAQVIVAKHKFAPAGQSALFDVLVGRRIP